MKTLAGTSAVVMIARSLAAASASRDAFGRVDPASANSDRSGPVPGGRELAATRDGAEEIGNPIRNFGSI